ncbi:MAG: EipA family protein [Pseudomonadota bacterium]|nr:EipA family protein [Pseudomonadota bacterium]
MKIINLYLLIFLALLSISCTNQPNKPDEDSISESIESANPVIPYQQDTILREAEIFFGSTAQGMADVLNQAFLDNGLPDAYIKGEEASGSIGIGVKFGHGDLFLSNGTTNKVFWRGPTLGFDIGGNATKVFILIYNLPSVDSLFTGRFGGVEGSLYYVGGFGLNYNQRNDIKLAPVRFGLGWRQGVNIGYIQLSKENSLMPF